MKRLTSVISGADVLAIVFAIGFSHACWYRRMAHRLFCCDADHYVSLGRSISLYGLFDERSYSPIRTYGYPLFLSFIDRVSHLLPGRIESWAFEFQLMLYIVAAWLLRREIAPFSKRIASVVFVGLLANVFTLTYLPETLTESLSLTCIVLLSSCWLWSARRFRTRQYFWAVLLGGALAGFAVMVRPANSYLILAWCAAQAVLVLRRGSHPGETVRRAAAMAVMLVAMAGPFLPQLRNNIVFGNTATPLVADNLMTFQTVVGITMLKYATGLRPNPEPKSRISRGFAVRYRNPFADPSKNLSRRFYLNHPGAGLLTLFIHSFGLLDQDLIFPYAVNLVPRYRVPLSIVNHLVIGMSLCGLLLWWRARSPLARASFPAIACYIVGLVGVYAPTATEARFGLPLMLLAGPLAVYAAGNFRLFPRTRAVAAAIAIYAVSAVALSGWIRNQSPVIAAQSEHPELSQYQHGPGGR